MDAHAVVDRVFALCPAERINSIDEEIAGRAQSERTEILSAIYERIITEEPSTDFSNAIYIQQKLIESMLATGQSTDIVVHSLINNGDQQLQDEGGKVAMRFAAIRLLLDKENRWAEAEKLLGRLQQNAKPMLLAMQSLLQADIYFQSDRYTIAAPIYLKLLLSYDECLRACILATVLSYPDQKRLRILACLLARGDIPLTIRPLLDDLRNKKLLRMDAEHLSSFRSQYPEIEERKDCFRRAVARSNLVAVSNLYSTVTFSRLTYLIGSNSLAETEELCAELSSSEATPDLRIDEPNGVVCFCSQTSPWNSINSCIERLCIKLCSLSDDIGALRSEE